MSQFQVGEEVEVRMFGVIKGVSLDSSGEVHYQVDGGEYCYAGFLRDKHLVRFEMPEVRADEAR